MITVMLFPQAGRQMGAQWRWQKEAQAQAAEAERLRWAAAEAKPVSVIFSFAQGPCKSACACHAPTRDRHIIETLKSFRFKVGAPAGGAPGGCGAAVAGGRGGTRGRGRAAAGGSGAGRGAGRGRRGAAGRRARAPGAAALGQARPRQLAQAGACTCPALRLLGLSPACYFHGIC